MDNGFKNNRYMEKIVQKGGRMARALTVEEELLFFSQSAS